MSMARSRPTVTRLKGVTYDVYVRLRDARGNDGYRMAYHDGVLEIISPAHRHERSGRRLGMLVHAYATVFHLECEPAGSTTFRKGAPGEPEGQGKEPDESFYLREEAIQVRDRAELDLTVDPPPSLWIEVDNWGSSASKLPLYARLGVPEVWRYRPRLRRLWFGRLMGSRYVPLAESRALPGLTPSLVLELLAEASARGTTGWDVWLREARLPALRDGLQERAAGD